jgi:16S rRNA (guanine(966)-N(2))-methyltransferase RsmD
VNHRPRPQQVRIIAGQWKRTPLPVATVDGLRPTPDRVRETVFNWLEHLQLRRWDNRRCLDLFAGTGALGFEAASRGAAEVVMVESNPIALRNLQAVCDKLKAHQVLLRQGDAVHLLPTLPGNFDLIFLDPPYQQRQLPVFLPACAQRLNSDGLVYAESDQPFDPSKPGAPDWLASWQVIRADKAGQVHFALLRPTDV